MNPLLQDPRLRLSALTARAGIHPGGCVVSGDVIRANEPDSFLAKSLENLRADRLMAAIAMATGAVGSSLGAFR
jgi:hypothetical protein